MKDHPAKKIFALLMALWCVGRLATLSGELRELDRELQALERIIAETELELAAPEKSGGENRRIEAGDLVFFDAGKRNCIVEVRPGRRK